MFQQYEMGRKYSSTTMIASRWSLSQLLRSDLVIPAVISSQLFELTLVANDAIDEDNRAADGRCSVRRRPKSTECFPRGDLKSSKKNADNT